MIDFDLVDDLLNFDNIKRKHVIYTDTDSIFLSLPIHLEEDRKFTLDYINEIQIKINKNILGDFLNLHNIKIREKEEIPLLPQRFKNEYLIKVIVLYSKKRYITITINYDDNGDIYYDKDLKGVEGKKDTYIFIKLLVDGLVEYLTSIQTYDDIYDRFDITNKVIFKYYKLLVNYIKKSHFEQISFFGCPVSVNKKVSDLKNVAGYYRGTLVFDALFEKYWAKNVGKGVWLRVKLKDSLLVDKIIDSFKQYENIKMKKNHFDMIRDITLPDDFVIENNPLLSKVFEYFDIDFDMYFDVLLKKISLLYKPFDITFFTDLNKRINKTLNSNYICVSKDYIYYPKLLKS